ncbi:hypothetical protein [Phytohabitans kaempferiae]|uniref:Uncharacterized protein n=1 Tax=Phytohabitans kaempferiae TaxID=1620943 RepID=A0ABV6M9L2_9ACTN
MRRNPAHQAPDALAAPKTITEHPDAGKTTKRDLYVHGLGVSRLSTVEFDGPPRQVEPLTVDELQDSIRRVSGTDVTITTMSSGTR